MAGIVIKVDTKQVERVFATAQKQIPFAIATAINDVAFQVQRAERAGIAATFKNPRPFTKNGVYVDKATKGNLSAMVRVGDAQAKYLTPFEAGGLHEIPGKALLNPKNVSLDAFGQLRKGQFKTLAARPGDFVGTIHGVAGLWQRPKAPSKTAARLARKAGQPVPRGPLKLLVRFGAALPVKEHLNFVERAKALVDAALPSALSAAIAKTINSMSK